MTYPGILILLGKRAAEYPEIVEMLCRAELYTQAAAKHDEIAPYIRSWGSYQAGRTRKYGRKPKSGTVPMIPAIALHREDREDG